jgi:hypothetical protein
LADIKVGESTTEEEGDYQPCNRTAFLVSAAEDLLFSIGLTLWLGMSLTFGARPRWDNPISKREPPNPEMEPVETTEMKMTAFIIWAKTGIPAFVYAMTKGDALVPEAPNRLGSSGETVMVTTSAPRR